MKAPVQKIQGWLQEVSVPRPAFPAEITDWKQKNMHNTDTNITEHLSTRKKSVSGEKIQTRATQSEVKTERGTDKAICICPSVCFRPDSAVEDDNGEGGIEKGILKHIYHTGQ